MPASPAQIAANQANSLKSRGPSTDLGKCRSRANSYKHGLTATVVMPEEDAAEVERLSRALAEELKAEGELGHALAHRMAVMSVRMDRCVAHQEAALAVRVRRAMDEFEAPEGASDREVGRLRAEAGDLALFDPSKGATLARKYEAAAERCFFRSLKELRQRSRDSAKVVTADAASKVKAEAASSLARLGSFLPAELKPAPAPSRPTPITPRPIEEPVAAWDFAPSGAFDVPLTIGRAR